MLSCQHRLEVLPEEELGFAAELRGNDVNRLMGIDGHEAGLGQLLCQAGPHHLQPLGGIYNRRTVQRFRQSNGKTVYHQAKHTHKKCRYFIL